MIEFGNMKFKFLGELFKFAEMPAGIGSATMCARRLTLRLMLCSLIMGILIAVGHHLFYHHLDQHIVASSNQQQWFVRVGTGLAFLFKVCLTAAATIAYTQILWRTLKSRSITINGLDALFGVVHDAWCFTSGELWRRGIELALLALIIW